MNLHSVTFRCSAAQHERLEQALLHHKITRTEFILHALENFLDFAEQEEIKKLDLFELVEQVDAGTEGPRFEEQA